MSEFLNDNPDPFKVRYLKSHGWEQLWHVDNWIESIGARHVPMHALDRAGRTTDAAYERAMRTVL